MMSVQSSGFYLYSLQFKERWPVARGTLIRACLPS
jgi:hypothetical protein